ncbi:hypothetical protein GCM10010293_40670 [Streptomyces griseoflavus]|uniref:DUF6221 family protein n=1 Tax=Streptomyces griseoflavus TaxID=35619 RepID=UPI00167CF53B|nr:DUF6221 family protein [Streptomyces griseoflavus]GGV37026.1 hypothetical protein GCM10010293_40670 [Streptomyces griseoflavus]
MSDIADFLRARYGERRAVAEAAASLQDDPENGWVIADDSAYAMPGKRRYISPHIGLTHEPESADHIVANNPAVVLVDLDAKLALIDEIEPQLEEDPPTDAELHALESHPAWKYRTTSGPRKQWADVDVPPCDDHGEPEPGWERNVDAGRDGWERWDYTEESYWRRLRPEGPLKPRIPRALKILAQPFAGHPDHKGEEWAP